MIDHKQWVCGIFDRAASKYGEKSSSFFNYFGKRLVDQVKITPGQKILDVATGKGAVLFPLAEAVGPQGMVLGVDISQAMLKETTKEVAKRDLHNIKLVWMDAEHLSFEDNSFDYVCCGFALFFLPSVPAALSEFKRVLKPGGKLVVSIWGEDSELDSLINEETQKICDTRTLTATPLWSGPELRRVLEQADFNEIQITEETKTFYHTSFEEWWDSLWSHGIRAKLEQLSSEQVATLQTQARLRVKPVDFPESLQVFYGVATKN